RKRIRRQLHVRASGNRGGRVTPLRHPRSYRRLRPAVPGILAGRKNKMPTGRQCIQALATMPGLSAAGPASAQQSAIQPIPAPLQIKAGISDPVNTVLAWYVARDAGLYLS